MQLLWFLFWRQFFWNTLYIAFHALGGEKFQIHLDIIYNVKQWGFHATLRPKIHLTYLLFRNPHSLAKMPLYEAIQTVADSDNTITKDPITPQVCRHWVGQTVAAFHWSRHWSVASPAWVRRPAARRSADTLNIWCKNCRMWQLRVLWSKKWGIASSKDTLPQPTRGLGELRELLQRGPGRSPCRQ